MGYQGRRKKKFDRMEEIENEVFTVCKIGFFDLSYFPISLFVSPLYSSVTFPVQIK